MMERFLKIILLTICIFCMAAVGYGVWLNLKPLLTQSPPGGTSPNLLDLKAIWLLILAVGAAILATYGDKLIQKIVKVGPSGVEFSSEEGLGSILRQPVQPSPMPSQGEPTSEPPLQKDEKEIYEKLKWKLLYLEEIERKDLSILCGKEKKNCIDLILKVGSYALRNNEPFKALNIFKNLEDVKLESKQPLKWLGFAYIKVGEELEDEAQKKKYFQNAVKFLETVIRENENDYWCYYNLGWTYDELGLIDKAIAANRKVIELYPPWRPYVKINTACSLIKKGDFQGAFRELSEIPKNRIWDWIEKDSELAPLREHDEYKMALAELIQERKDS